MQALTKWPDVPDCTGWLALDARGRWRIGEGGAGPREPVTHAATIAYMNRNYLRHGRCWILQNGPQRVFVDLEYTPYVWRLVPREGGGWDFVSHTGQPAIPQSIWLDDEGRFLAEATIATEAATIGVIHDHDTTVVTELLRDERGDPIDDDTLDGLSSLQPTQYASAAAAAMFRWKAKDGEVVMPLRRISSGEVPGRFAFEPRPSTVLRVDRDTRR